MQCLDLNCYTLRGPRRSAGRIQHGKGVREQVPVVLKCVNRRPNSTIMIGDAEGNRLTMGHV